MNTPQEIADGIWMIDAHMFGAPENLSTYVIPDPVPTLVEPGPSTCHEAVMVGLAAMGLDELAQVVATHIHLDHAGGTGNLVERFPGAQVFIHQIGAPHMVDPSKLLASAERIYGEEGMRELWGPITPVEPSLMHAVDEGDIIAIGPDRRLEVLYTPGHAKHHMSLIDSATGIAMIGDSVGLTFPEMEIVNPIVPPPDIDVELLVSQFKKYRDREVPVLAFAHFGLKHDVGHILEESERRLRMWTDIAIRHRDETPEDVGARIRDATLTDLRGAGHPEEHIQRMDQRMEYATEASGLLRYVHGAHPSSPHTH
ncbi:MAG: MBL fold metallo-hydrolase [Actinobacteria bacterium ATB1]|nr:MBL fold metallo-hydrolase [Actinobacteria bacterium ATB1]